MADAHVLDYAPANRGDAFLGHAMLLSEARLLTPRFSDRTRPPRYRAAHDDTHQTARGALPRERFSSLTRCGLYGWHKAAADYLTRHLTG
jgi:hypothetical protein